MILVAVVVFMLIMILVNALADKKELDIVFGASLVIMLIALVVVLIMGIVCVVNHAGLDVRVAELEKQREALVYQAEHHLYDEDITGMAKKELAKEITDWNANLAASKKNQYDFWVGIFTPDIYDQFEFIPWDDMEKTKGV